MTRTIMKAVQDLIKDNAIIQELLGSEYVSVAEIMQPAVFPSITIRMTSEGSKKRVGYDTFKKRDNTPMIQVDIWSKESRLETYNLADQIDELLVGNSVPNTRSWIKVSDSDMFEQDTRIYHKPLRYSFEYTLTDTTGFQLGVDQLGVHFF